MSKNDNANNINETLLTKMKVQILEAEQRNLNTAEKTNDQMVELVQKTIQNLADKSY